MTRDLKTYKDAVVRVFIFDSANSQQRLPLICSLILSLVLPLRDVGNPSSWLVVRRQLLFLWAPGSVGLIRSVKSGPLVSLATFMGPFELSFATVMGPPGCQ